MFRDERLVCVSMASVTQHFISLCSPQALVPSFGFLPGCMQPQAEHSELEETGDLVHSISSLYCCPLTFFSFP